MDVNAIVSSVGLASGASPVVPNPAPASQPKVQSAEPVLNAQAFIEQTAERVQPASTDALARTSAAVSHGVRLRIDDATSQVIAQIVNESNEVIKQIPPEESLRIAARFRQLTGMLFNQEA